MADRVKGGEDPSPAVAGRDGIGQEIARYEQILSREPCSLVFAALSEAYRKRRMLSQAIEVCRRGLRSHPRFASGRVALARAYFDAGQVELCRQELEKVIVTVPDNLVALRLLAAIYRDRSDLGRLEPTARQILALDPGDGEAAESLEWARSLRKGIALNDEKGCGSREIVTRTLAEIYASQGYLERAVEIYGWLCRREPENAPCGERLAQLREKLAMRSARAKGKGEHKGESPDSGCIAEEAGGEEPA
ncbi:MAG: tetratricopeptide repeat protein [bacterium]